MEKISRVTAACLLLFVVQCMQPALGVAGERPAGSALQFGMGNYFNLTRFGGVTMSYQRFLSEDLAWRLGATIELDYNTVEQTADGTGQYEGSDSDAFEDWDNRIAISCEWLVYRGSDVSLYFGGGPYVFYDTEQHAYSDFFLSDDHDDTYWHRRIHNTSLGLGASGVIGVQWAPAEWCALHVEYRAVAAYVREVYSEHRETIGGSDEYTLDEEQANSGFEFDSKDVRAGVSIYF